jgi:hypothetical protein
MGMTVEPIIEAAPEACEGPEAANSRWWSEHFAGNVARQLEIPWENCESLPESHRRILVASLQDFQLGESSEGKHGLARATVHGLRSRDTHYAKAVRLFFAEENRHAGYLARYLKLQGAEVIGRSWTDFAFRRVRRLMALETLLRVLLTAELIGEVYYRAIRAATNCPTLRAICTQLLRDERMHVRFHVERFGYLQRGRSRMRLRLEGLFWRSFFTATCLAVWAKHRRAFRLGGCGFSRFWIESRRGLRRTL